MTNIFMIPQRCFPGLYFLFLSLFLLFCLAQLSEGKPSKSGSKVKKADVFDDNEDYFYEETDREIKKTIPIRHGHPAVKTKVNSEEDEDNRDMEVRVVLKNPKEEILHGEKRKIQINKIGGDYKLKETDRMDILPPLKLDADEYNPQETAVIRKRLRADAGEIKKVVGELAVAMLAEADQYYDSLTAELNVDSSLSAWNTGNFQQVNEIEDDDLDYMFSSPLNGHQMNSLNDGEYDGSLFDYEGGSYIC